MSSEVIMPAAARRLDAALSSADPADVLAAAWETLDYAGQFADAIAWEPGSDELRALVAAQNCDAARSALPLPEAGRPLVVSVSGSGLSPDPYVALLRRTDVALRGLAARAEVSEESRSVLDEAARQAASAADALATVREG